MTKTIDKVLLGVLVIFLVGMSAVLITALNGEKEKTSSQILLGEVTSGQSNEAALNSASDADENEGEEDENDNEDLPITGNALEKASAAALSYVGQGRVTDTEIGDEEDYYEIEITLDNGNQVDVHLNENFKVLSTEYEDED